MDQVQTGVTSQPRGVVMVAMDGEDRQPDVQVGILVVDRLGVAVGEVHQGVRQVLHLHRPVAKHVVAQDLKTFYLS